MTELAAGKTPHYKEPSDDSLEIARLIKGRLGKRDRAPIRVAFIGSNDSVREAGENPPLARLLRGGRGGEVRLKLELSFLWFAVNPPHDLSYPARVWALLLGLDDPEGRGTRRVRQAMSALEAAELIWIRTSPGQPSRITLLDEGGSGDPYKLPGDAYNKARGTGNEWRHRYIQVPDTLWTNGWIATLSGAAVAMLLVLFAELGQRDHRTVDLWFSPSHAQKIYAISEDTRSKGLRELRGAGLISARKKPASRDALDFRRLRNTYRLELDKLNERALVPVNINPPRAMTPSQTRAEELLQGFAKRVGDAK
ncbi:hypothetical protein SAMN04488693_1412 [Arthrobacter subterraneus]|uniref:Uncharacterized protein n=1 Tax=Arthrobacter subterraneus TaxID=335973 RepID=A0A1G8Q0X5_9MICC|nr:hypothetical protein [Arthrobacter subterraneus]SDI98343.1 hypothetical protein SAMN04488693_1412 [Arthrobacter subterraneus]